MYFLVFVRSRVLLIKYKLTWLSKTSKHSQARA